MSEPATTSNGCFTYLLTFLVAIFGAFMAAGNIAINPLITPSTDIAIYVSLVPSVESFTEAELQYSADVITKRLDGLGFETATVEIIDATIIKIGLPPLDNLDDVVLTLSSRGLLEFVDFSDVPDYAAWTEREILTTGQGDHPISDTAAVNPTTNQPFITVFLGEDVEAASAGLDDQFGQRQVSLTFTELAGNILREYTRTHIRKPLGIVLDGKVLSIPIIQSELGREAVIQGNFTEEETRRLAVQLGGGALPFALVVNVIRGDFGSP